jgi:hypothetical protein
MIKGKVGRKIKAPYMPHRQLYALRVLLDPTDFNVDERLRT